VSGNFGATPCYSKLQEEEEEEQQEEEEEEEEEDEEEWWHTNQIEYSPVELSPTY
jgi:hypothetical protein